MDLMELGRATCSEVGGADPVGGGLAHQSHLCHYIQCDNRWAEAVTSVQEPAACKMLCRALVSLL